MRARRALGYKSAKKFADAIGISESSVANAESGRESVGEGVFMDIETALRWPEDCITRYIETGDESVLPSVSSPTPAEGEPRDSWERKLVQDFPDMSLQRRLELFRMHRSDKAQQRRKKGDGVTRAG